MTTTRTPGAERARSARPRPRRLTSPIQRMRVGTKLVLLAMLPVCSVVGLVVVSAVSGYRTASRLSSYRADARLSFALAPLAVDLAHERRAAVLARLDPGAAADAQLVASERATTLAFEQTGARAVRVVGAGRRRGRPGCRATAAPGSRPPARRRLARPSTGHRRIQRHHAERAQPRGHPRRRRPVACPRAGRSRIRTNPSGDRDRLARARVRGDAPRSTRPAVAGNRIPVGYVGGGRVERVPPERGGPAGCRLGFFRRRIPAERTPGDATKLTPAVPCWTRPRRSEDSYPSVLIWT
jgi:hypothetical protein